MKKLLVFLMALFMASNSFVQAGEQLSIDTIEIKNAIDQYVDSINKADPRIGGNIFLQSDSISFIHPKGYVKGWEKIEKNFYGMFEKTFTQRALKISNQDIQIYGNMAVVVFSWVFDATFNDGSPIQTKGRETQVYNKIDKEWKIVHIHYSNMPVTGERDGF